MKGILRPQISTCQHDQSLLFQFILSDFLAARQEFESIQLQKEISDTTLSSIIQTITNLSGPLNEYMRIFSWNHDYGCLVKLKNHCAFFLQNSDPDDKRAASLEKNSNKVWHLALHILDFAYKMQEPLDRKKKNKELLHMINLWEDGIAELDRSLTSSARILAKFIPDFADDENVMFFILKSHERIDRAFGKNFTAKTFRDLYANLQKAEQFLQKNYSHRGFHNLIPIISDKINELNCSICRK